MIDPQDALLRSVDPDATERRVFNVKARWDAQARVWWAESDDVPGLVAEADTHDQLVEDLRRLVPELLAMNKPELLNAMITFRLYRIVSRKFTTLKWPTRSDVIL